MSEQHRQVHCIFLRGTILCLTLFCSVLVYSFRLTSFLHAKEAVLVLGLCGMAVTALYGHPSLLRQGFRAFRPLWALLGLSALLHLALVPCHVPSDAVVELARWASLLLCGAYAYGLLQDDKWRRRILVAVSASAVLAALLGLVQYFGLAPSLFPSFDERTQRMYSVFGNQDLFGGYLAIAVPILVHGFLAAPRKRAFAALCGLSFVLPGLLLSGSRTAWLATAVGVLVVALFGVKSWRRAAVLATVMGTTSLATVMLAPDATVRRVLITFTKADVGGRARLWFWDGSLRMIGAHPWLGVGPGNYAYWSPHYLGEALHAPGGERHYHNLVHTLHAHCEPLELVAETGLLGVVFGLWMLTRFVRCREVEWAPLAALSVFCLFNAGLHSTPHALAGILLAALLFARQERVCENGKQCGSGRRRFAWLSLVAVVALTAFVLYCVVMPSYGLRRAEQTHLSGETPFDAYERVLAHRWPNAAAHEKYGIALFEARRYDDARGQFELALRGMDTGGIYLLLGMMAAQEGEDAEAREYLEQCLFRWPSNELAWKLLLRTSARGRLLDQGIRRTRTHS